MKTLLEQLDRAKHSGWSVHIDENWVITVSDMDGGKLSQHATRLDLAETLGTLLDTFSQVQIRERDSLRDDVNTIRLNLRNLLDAESDTRRVLQELLYFLTTRDPEMSGVDPRILGLRDETHKRWETR